MAMTLEFQRVTDGYGNVIWIVRRGNTLARDVVEVIADYEIDRLIVGIKNQREHAGEKANQKRKGKA